MILFNINETGKFIQYNEQNFKVFNKEIDLENLLENNPNYFLESCNILIIGRQVPTNLNSIIDLLGIDYQGNAIVIELKRDKTNRETIAQLIEYASFVESLDYYQLNIIFQNYSNEESELSDYHSVYFQTSNELVSWNKSSKLIIVAQEITIDIKQSASYLRTKGVDINCVEFKYFVNSKNDRIISSDYVVGNDTIIKMNINSGTKLPKANKETFLKNLNSSGKEMFKILFDFIEKEKLLVRWGSKGFSINVTTNNNFIGLIFCYPINCPYGQSIITGFKQIEKKITNSENIVNHFRSNIKKLNFFSTSVGYLGNNELKWKIESFNENEAKLFIEILRETIKLINDQKIN